MAPKKKKSAAAAAAAAAATAPNATAAPATATASASATAAAPNDIKTPALTAGGTASAVSTAATASTAAAGATTTAASGEAAAAALDALSKSAPNSAVASAAGSDAPPLVFYAPKSVEPRDFMLPSKAASLAEANAESKVLLNAGSIRYIDYVSEHQLAGIQSLIDRELSEPYSVFTYRYFVNSWPQYCLLALDTANGNKCVGTIVGQVKPDNTNRSIRKGYIAMLAVDVSYRTHGIGRTLVSLVVDRMRAAGTDLVVLQTEATNASALRLYERLDFVRDKRLPKYYLNGGDAFELKLWLRPPPPPANQIEYY